MDPTRKLLKFGAQMGEVAEGFAALAAAVAELQATVKQLVDTNQALLARLDGKAMDATATIVAPAEWDGEQKTAKGKK